MTQTCTQLRDQTHQGEQGEKWQACTEMYQLIGYPAETPQPRSNRVRPPSNGNGRCHGSVVSAQMMTPEHEVSHEESPL